MHNLSATDRAWWDRFQNLLDDQIEWPSEYLFKFIVPSERLDDLKRVFEGHPVKVRSSSKGNYKSVTARIKMHSSSDVVAVYNAVAEVEGVISL